MLGKEGLIELYRRMVLLRTFDDYSGSPTQHTNPGWDDVTGLGTPNGLPLP